MIFLSPTLNKNLCFNNSKLFLHSKWYLIIMLVNFYLNKFFLHDITLIASVLGESVIGHGIDRILIPVKWHDLLKASCWSKRQQKLVTGPYSHSNRLIAQRSKYMHTPCSMRNSYTEYPPPWWLKYHRYFHQSQYIHMRNLDRTFKRSHRQRLRVCRLGTSTASQKWWVFPHHNRILNTIGSCRILHDAHMFGFCIKPFCQPRDAAWREESWTLDEKSYYVLRRCGRAKGIC